jgi:hypothetical protein
MMVMAAKTRPKTTINKMLTTTRLPIIPPHKQSSVPFSKGSAKFSKSMAYNEIEQAILTTLHYSALFDFPLTQSELWKFLISKRAIARDELRQIVQILQKKKQIYQKDNYYFLPGKEKTISMRKTRSIFSQKKLVQARTIAKLLENIPTLYFIGISGSLAMENAKDDDDIDFFIITQKNTLFITRLLILLTLEIKGVRRKYNDKNPKDTICVNLLVDETALEWPEQQQDLYTAHEIIQVKPLFQRQNTYTRFLKANTWILQFLPNFIAGNTLNEKKNKKSLRQLSNAFWFRVVILFLLRSLEPLARALQLFIIKRHKTFEEVQNHHLAFHPHNYRTNFISHLKLTLKKAGLLTKV